MSNTLNQPYDFTYSKITIEDENFYDISAQHWQDALTRAQNQHNIDIATTAINHAVSFLNFMVDLADDTFLKSKYGGGFQLLLNAPGAIIEASLEISYDETNETWKTVIIETGEEFINVSFNIVVGTALSVAASGVLATAGVSSALILGAAGLVTTFGGGQIIQKFYDANISQPVKDIIGDTLQPDLPNTGDQDIQIRNSQGALEDYKANKSQTINAVMNAMNVDFTHLEQINTGLSDNLVTLDDGSKAVIYQDDSFALDITPPNSNVTYELFTTDSVVSSSTIYSDSNKTLLSEGKDFVLGVYIGNSQTSINDSLTFFDEETGEVIGYIKYTDENLNETNYKRPDQDVQDVADVLTGGAHYFDPDDLITTTGSGGFSSEYFSENATIDVDGESYFLSNVLDSFTKAGEAVTSFINNQVGAYFDNTFDAHNISSSIGQFFSKYGQDLIDGNISSDDAAKYFVLEIAEGGLDTTVANSLLSTEMKDLRDVLADPNSTQQQIQDALDAVNNDDDLVAVLNYLGFENSIALSTSIKAAIATMAVEFALHSNGWDSDDYAKAGVGVISGVAVEEFVSGYLNIGGAAGAGYVAGLTTIAVGLTNSSEYNSSDYASLGVSAASAFGAAYATAAIGGAITTASGVAFASTATLSGTVGASILGTGAGTAAAASGAFSTSAIIAGGAALAGIGLVIALAANEIISSIYSGKKFYAGEYGDKQGLINTLYQVQQVDDGNGNMVDAVVATNSSGSTILLSNIQAGINHMVGNSGADILVGVETDDVISGGGGSDYIEGKDGDEKLFGGDGNDHIIGNAGNDVISGDAGHDIIFGDAGADTIIGGNGQDFIHGGGGSDAVNGGDLNDTLLGAGGDDVISGEDGDDMIDGGYGDDLLDGGDGDDIMLGNLGNDSITGGAGDDKIFGDVGNDRIMGDAGNDYINGGEGVDVLEGGNGSDLIYGDIGNDYLQGDLGDDDLLGGEGNDDLLGGLDDDYLYGMEGEDDLQGGDGDDILVGGEFTDSLTGGEGSDVYVLEADDSGLYGNDVIVESAGANDRIYINGLDSSNIASLDFEQDGDDLIVKFGAVSIATVAGHFASGADSIERIEFDTDQYIDLSTLSFSGGVASFTTATDSTQTTEADIDAREAVIDSNLQFQTQFWNNAFLQNLSEVAYEEALRDQFETEFYNGGNIIEFKRSRGKFGGHYKVYKLQQNQVLEGERELKEIEELTAGSYDAADYDQVLTSATKVTTTVSMTTTTVVDGLGTYGPFTGDLTLYDIWDGSNLIDTYFIAEGEIYRLEDLAGGSGYGYKTTYSFSEDASQRLISGTSETVILGIKSIESGSDHLVGSYWAEVIHGQSGDDALFGGNGADVITGGAGNDWVFGGDGHDDLDGGDGSDVIFGGSGGDEISGGTGDDAIIGGNGADEINGDDGSDWIDAGNGDDIIYGGAGDDIIYAGYGDDYAEGNEGIDVIYGQGGNDELWGNEGEDYLYGGTGNDKLYGVEDADYLYGNEDDDIIEGNGGDDELWGGSGNDILSGGAGADNIVGGDGIDYIDYRTSSAAITISLLAGTVSGGDAAGDTFSYIEGVWGSANDDDITGDDETNYLIGDAGADTINALGGNDYLYGDLGGDTLNGGDGIDRVLYNLINDTLTIDLINQTVTNGVNTDTLVSIENVYGSEGNDTIIGSTDSTALNGYLGDDIITGSTVIDYLYGHDGADTLNGGDNDDVLFGGNGADTLNGGNGDYDSANYSDSDVGVTINLTTNVNTGGTAEGDTFNSIEVIGGSNYSDDITGDANENRLYGYDGNDTLDGKDGDDRLKGHGGVDTLYGGNGNDELYGGDGNDYVYGNGGDDWIFGDEGNDVIDAGAGTLDTLDFSDTSYSVLVDLSNQFASGSYIGLDYVINFERVVGSAGDDVIIGRYNDYDDILDGFDGNDAIEGLSGNDTLYGGSGIDSLYGNTGADSLYGGSGDDLLCGGSGADLLDGGNGSIDIADYSSSGEAVNINFATDTYSGGHANGDVLVNIEGASGSNFDDVLTGNGDDNRFYGNVGDDAISGGSGDDTVWGGYGADTIDGGNGTLDSANYSDSGTFVTINLETNVNIGGSAEGDSLTSIEVVGGSDFGDDITGNWKANRLYGYDGNDSLYGRTGDDRLKGHDGADMLFGEEGADELYGGTGNDALDGGAGQDQLYGEAGADVFVFSDLTDSVVGARDIIRDFEQGSDVIDLTSFSFTSLTDFTVTQDSTFTIVEDNSSTFAFKLEGMFTLDDNDFLFS